MGGQVGLGLDFVAEGDFLSGFFGGVAGEIEQMDRQIDE